MSGLWEDLRHVLDKVMKSGENIDYNLQASGCQVFSLKTKQPSSRQKSIPHIDPESSGLSSDEKLPVNITLTKKRKCTTKVCDAVSSCQDNTRKRILLSDQKRSIELFVMHRTNPILVETLGKNQTTMPQNLSLAVVSQVPLSDEVENSFCCKSRSVV